jgi:hypothetical protein
MRAPSERDQCQAMLDILVEGFMRDDVPAYREAYAWLRDFAYQRNIEQGRVMCGSNWYTPREFEALRERSRMHALEGWRRRKTTDDVTARRREAASRHCYTPACLAWTGGHGTEP